VQGQTVIKYVQDFHIRGISDFGILGAEAA
jgi:hypothetical protein